MAASRLTCHGSRLPATRCASRVLESRTRPEENCTGRQETFGLALRVSACFRTGKYSGMMHTSNIDKKDRRVNRMFQLPICDSVGLVWFLVLWIGYTLFTDRGTPRSPVIGEPRDDDWIRRAAWLSTLTSKDFNHGPRAYYFGNTVIARFVSGWTFMIAAAAVADMLYWREYHSQALRAPELPIAESLARKSTS